MKNLLLAALASVLAGCASVEITQKGSLSDVDLLGATTPADRHILITNGGMHLFWIFTVATGDLSWDEKKNDIAGGIAWFDDQAGCDHCYAALQNIARRENCDLVDVVFNNASTSDLDCSSAEGLLAGFIGMSDVQCSAVLRPKTAAKTEEVAR